MKFQKKTIMLQGLCSLRYCFLLLPWWDFACRDFVPRDTVSLSSFGGILSAGTAPWDTVSPSSFGGILSAGILFPGIEFPPPPLVGFCLQGFCSLG